MEQHGIENLKMFAFALLDSADMVGDIFSDGKVTFGDVGPLMKIADIGPTIGKSFIKLPAEAGDLSNEEEQELRAAIKEHAAGLKADVEDDKIESIAEAALTAAIKVSAVVSEVMKAFKANQPSEEA